MDIVVDFDGTCTTHAYPEIGKEIGAIPVLQRLVRNGHRLILFTMRSDNMNDSGKGRQTLSEAVNWFAQNNIELYGIQSNPTQPEWTSSPKAYGQMYIDDAALGCPIKWDRELSKRPFADWVAIEQMLKDKGMFSNEEPITTIEL